MEQKIMISKTRIEKRMQKKTNPILVETIIALKKVNPMVAKIIAGPRRKMVTLNLEQIAGIAKTDKILIPGKVLGLGELNKKMKIVAVSASKEAREKMKKAKIEFVELTEELKTNKQLKDLEIVK